MRSILVLAVLLAVQLALATTKKHFKKQSQSPNQAQIKTTTDPSETIGSGGQLTCSAKKTGEHCGDNNVVISVSCEDGNKNYPLYHSCFDEEHLHVLYVNHAMTPKIIVNQPSTNGESKKNKQKAGNNKDGPKWQCGDFFPGVDPDKIYRRNNQKKVLSDYIGPELVGKYIIDADPKNNVKEQILTRGHLAAKGDFGSATDQCATFHFINAAPQWKSFNGGNWNTLEQDLRARSVAALYNTDVYTGTFGVMKLHDKNNQPHDIYLLPPSQIPVPLYFYKVVYDASRLLGTAFVGINNPYYTKNEAEDLVFCKNSKCRVNEVTWLKIKNPHNVQLGYIFCCTVDELRDKIPFLPPLQTEGLLLKD